MQNAAFTAAGLDWRYSAFDIEDPVAAVRALATLGFAGNCGPNDNRREGDACAARHLN
jgi:shikimate 5-dehydrogenase